MLQKMFFYFICFFAATIHAQPPFVTFNNNFTNISHRAISPILEALGIKDSVKLELIDLTSNSQTALKQRILRIAAEKFPNAPASSLAYCVYGKFPLERGGEILFRSDEKKDEANTPRGEHLIESEFFLFFPHDNIEADGSIHPIDIKNLLVVHLVSEKNVDKFLKFHTNQYLESYRCQQWIKTLKDYRLDTVGQYLLSGLGSFATMSNHLPSYLLIPISLVISELHLLAITLPLLGIGWLVMSLFNLTSVATMIVFVIKTIPLTSLGGVSALYFIIQDPRTQPDTIAANFINQRATEKILFRLENGWESHLNPEVIGTNCIQDMHFLTESNLSVDDIKCKHTNSCKNGIFSKIDFFNFKKKPLDKFIGKFSYAQESKFEYSHPSLGHFLTVSIYLNEDSHLRPDSFIVEWNPKIFQDIIEENKNDLKDLWTAKIQQAYCNEITGGVIGVFLSPDDSWKIKTCPPMLSVNNFPHLLERQPRLKNNTVSIFEEELQRCYHAYESTLGIQLEAPERPKNQDLVYKKSTLFNLQEALKKLEPWIPIFSSYLDAQLHKKDHQPLKIEKIDHPFLNALIKDLYEIQDFFPTNPEKLSPIHEHKVFFDRFLEKTKNFFQLQIKLKDPTTDALTEEEAVLLQIQMNEWLKFLLKCAENKSFEYFNIMLPVEIFLKNTKSIVSKYRSNTQRTPSEEQLLNDWEKLHDFYYKYIVPSYLNNHQEINRAIANDQHLQSQSSAENSNQTTAPLLLPIGIQKIEDDLQLHLPNFSEDQTNRVLKLLVNFLKNEYSYLLPINKENFEIKKQTPSDANQEMTEIEVDIQTNKTKGWFSLLNRLFINNKVMRLKLRVNINELCNKFLFSDKLDHEAIRNLNLIQVETIETPKDTHPNASSFYNKIHNIFVKPVSNLYLWIVKKVANYYLHSDSFYKQLFEHRLKKPSKNSNDTH